MKKLIELYEDYKGYADCLGEDACSFYDWLTDKIDNSYTDISIINLLRDRSLEYKAEI